MKQYPITNNIRRLTYQWRRMSFHAHYRYTYRPSLYRQNTFIFIRYELHVVHCNDKPQCVDCILLRTDIRRANGRIRDDSNDEQNGKKKRDCRLIYIYLRIPMQTRTKNILLKRRNITSLGTRRVHLHIYLLETNLIKCYVIFIH
ncbi:hypothetical protein ALC62_06002 [Cyphomyrmex costatus]|uniref:Uncharacterized protein n=1 Tax=Cyphomyrmex costatus TaxID=456900 RepID=A0A195CR73_9HYME|nr:hypothetical protein ALC62_06002 [Cyphomyrmex costatus]